MPFAASTTAIAGRRQEVGLRTLSGAAAHARATLRAGAVLFRVPSHRVPRSRSAQRGLHLPRGPAVRRGAFLSPNVAAAPRKIPAYPDFSSLGRGGASPTTQTTCANLAAPPTTFPNRGDFPQSGIFPLCQTTRATPARRWHPTADRPPRFGVRRPGASPAPLIPLNGIVCAKCCKMLHRGNAKGKNGPLTSIRFATCS